MPDADAASEEEREQALHAMGWSMGQSLNLHMGFSDADLDLIFKGLREASEGGEPPENLEEMLPLARAIYVQLQNDYRQQQEAMAAEIAKENLAEAETYFAELAEQEGIEQTESGLFYEILESGSEKQAGPRDRVKVLYTGRLTDGTEFDSATDRDRPANFGVNRVVPGFSEGLQLIGEGGKIRLHIPAELGYGTGPQRPDSPIEPGSTLIFDVEVLEVIPAPERPTGTPRTAPNRGTPPPPPPDMQPPGPPPDVTPPPPPSHPPPSRPDQDDGA